MKVIGHVELSSQQAAITFNGIPQSFTDLYLVFSLSTTAASTNSWFRINGSTANLSVRTMFGNGSNVTNETVARVVAGTDAEDSNFSNCQMYLLDYAKTTVNKAWTIEATEGTSGQTSYHTIQSGRFASNSAITSIELYDTGGGNFRVGSTATLYGITAGSDGITTVS